MSVNKEFADIVFNSLEDVDILGDDILQKEGMSGTRIFTDQMPPLAFPFGYMIISSTFMFYDDEDENGNTK